MTAIKLGDKRDKEEEVCKDALASSSSSSSSSPPVDKCQFVYWVILLCGESFKESKEMGLPFDQSRGSGS